MSGKREILEWVDDNWIFNPALNIQQEYALISAAFEEDNRSPLDHILRDDKPSFLKELADRKSAPQRKEEARGRDARFESFKLEPETLPRLPRREKGIISKVIGFLKGLFK